jgi:hypothetical protein
MSKKNQPLTAEEVMEEVPQTTPQGKTVQELKEIAHNLQSQLQQHQELVDKYRNLLNHEATMMTKLQGGLEVALLMLPKEEVEKMVAEHKASQNRTNGQKEN